MSAKSLTAEWIEIFTKITRPGQRPRVAAFICVGYVGEYLTSMYDDLSLLQPSDVLRHRLTDEARAAYAATAELGILFDAPRIPTHWQDLEAWILAGGEA